jgi:excisionase family DNA binding protein
MTSNAMMTVRETAEAFRVNTKTVYAMIGRGDLRCVRVGRLIRIPRTVVASLLEQGRVAPPGRVHGSTTR